MSNLITIEKFCDATGYTPDAVRSKIKRGDWLEEAVWVKAPDGRILISMKGYEWWVVHGKAASAELRRAQSKWISTIVASAVASA